MTENKNQKNLFQIPKVTLADYSALGLDEDKYAPGITSDFYFNSKPNNSAINFQKKEEESPLKNHLDLKNLNDLKTNNQKNSSKKPILKDLKKEHVKFVWFNIIRAFALLVLFLSIIRVPYFGNFIDAVILGFSFGWTRYLIYSLLFTAIILSWFPKYYRYIFNWKRWLLFFGITLALSLIISGIGAYVLKLRTLNFKEYFINISNKVPAYRSYITYWYKFFWFNDMIRYSVYKISISPSHYEYGGLFGVFWAAAFSFASSAFVLAIGIIAIVFIALFLSKWKNKKIKLLEFKKKKQESLGYKKLRLDTSKKPFRLVQTDQEDLSSKRIISPTSSDEQSAFSDDLLESDDVINQQDEIIADKQIDEEAVIKYQNYLQTLDKSNYPKFNWELREDYDPIDLHIEALKNFSLCIEQVLKDLNLDYTLENQEVGFRTVSVDIKLEKEIDTSLQELIINRLKALNIDENLNVYWNDSQNANFVLFIKQNSVLSLPSLIKCIGHDNPLYFGIGKKFDRDNYYVNGILEPNNIIFGGTGSGSIMLLSNIVLSLCFLNSPSYLKGYLIDTTDNSLKTLYKLIHLDDRVACDVTSAYSLLEKVLEEEIKPTLEKLRLHNVETIYDYNQLATVNEPLINKFLIVHDLTELMTDDKEAFTPLINEILLNSYKCGLIVIFSSTTVNLETILFNEEMDNVFVLKLDSLEDSQILLDSDLAIRLSGKGDMYLKSVDAILRIQAMYSNRERSRLIVNEINNSFK